MENDKMKLSPPWITYYHKVQALFEKDESITVTFNEDKCHLNIIVQEDDEKGEAIRKLFPSEKVFGNNIMKINIMTIGEEKKMPTVQIFTNAFKNNPVVEDIINASNILQDDQTYIMFQNKVVQFFNDDFSDYNGVCSTLYQDIAKNVFTDFTDVHYCTSTNINKDVLFDDKPTKKDKEVVESIFYGLMDALMDGIVL